MFQSLLLRQSGNNQGFGSTNIPGKKFRFKKTSQKNAAQLYVDELGIQPTSGANKSARVHLYLLVASKSKGR
jgi:hypothetical protein